MLTATVGLLALLRHAQVTRNLDPEWVRKLFHIGGGILGLALPWVFDDIVPVLLLGALVGLLFFLMRVVPALRENLGQVLLGIRRKTVGDFCFVASFALLFWLARGDKLLYSIPILLVALADALAALIGQTYGKFPLHMHGDRKTIEGAFTFLLIAFLCIHVPVLLSGKTGRVESLLIAVDIGFMVMLAEAAAWWGLDNLLIPILGYMALKSMLAMDAAALLAHLGFVLGLGVIVYLARPHTTLGDDALAGGVLWGYVIWAVGGWEWVVPPLLQLIAYANVTGRTPRDHRRNLGFPVVLANTVGSIFWLLLYRETDDTAFFIPFVACHGMNMGIVTLVRLMYVEPNKPQRAALRYSIATGMMIAIPSLLPVYGLGAMTVIGLGTFLVTIAATTLVFRGLQPDLSRYPVDPARQMRQAIVVTTGSCVAFGIELGQLWALQSFQS
jgi:phytol kinase